MRDILLIILRKYEEDQEGQEGLASLHLLEEVLYISSWADFVIQIIEFAKWECLRIYLIILKREQEKESLLTLSTVSHAMV